MTDKQFEKDYAQKMKFERTDKTCKHFIVSPCSNDCKAYCRGTTGSKPETISWQHANTVCQGKDHCPGYIAPEENLVKFDKLADLLLAVEDTSEKLKENTRQEKQEFYRDMYYTIMNDMLDDGDTFMYIDDADKYSSKYQKVKSKPLVHAINKIIYCLKASYCNYSDELKYLTIDEVVNNET